MNTPVISGAASSFGGEAVIVTYRSAFTIGERVFAAGETEPVLVRELEVDPNLLRFGALIDKTAELADFVCDRPPGWARALAKLSLVEIYDKAIDLNFTTARLYLESRAKLARQLKGADVTTPASTISAAASG